MGRLRRRDVCRARGRSGAATGNPPAAGARAYGRAPGGRRRDRRRHKRSRRRRGRLVPRARQRHDRGTASRARARSAYLALPRAGAEDPGTSAVGHGPPRGYRALPDVKNEVLSEQQLADLGMRMQEMKTELTTQARPSPRSPERATGRWPSHRAPSTVLAVSKENIKWLRRACAGPFPEFRQRKLADPRRGISDLRYLLDIACAGQCPRKCVHVDPISQIATTCQIEYKNEGSTTPSGLGGANTTSTRQIRLSFENRPDRSLPGFSEPIDDHGCLHHSNRPSTLP